MLYDTNTNNVCVCVCVYLENILVSRWSLLPRKNRLIFQSWSGKNRSSNKRLLYFTYSCFVLFPSVRELYLKFGQITDAYTRRIFFPEIPRKYVASGRPTRRAPRRRVTQTETRYPSGSVGESLPFLIINFADVFTRAGARPHVNVTTENGGNDENSGGATHGRIRLFVVGKLSSWPRAMSWSTSVFAQAETRWIF